MSRRSERERLTERGAEVDVTTEELAAGTPSIPCERFECDGCGAKCLGDPRESDLCTQCRRERGLEVPEALPEGVGLFDEYDPEEGDA